MSEELDGLLAASEQDRLEDHLAGCVSCRRQREELRQTVRLVSQLGRQRCPVDLQLAVLDRVTREERTAPPARWTLLQSLRSAGGARVALACAGAAAALALGMRLLPGGGEPEDLWATVRAPRVATAVNLKTWHDANRAQQALGTTDSLVLSLPEVLRASERAPQ
jgi:anti-sigma factor RsiW